MKKQNNPFAWNGAIASMFGENAVHVATENIPASRAIIINQYLEDYYSSAKTADDVELMHRVSRALAAFNADPEMEIFTEEFKEKYYAYKE